MSDDNHITDPMTEEWYCPNAPEHWVNGTYTQQHRLFTRRYETVEERIFLPNGRWMFGDPGTQISERPVSLLKCRTCGAKAQRRRIDR